jgi:hypothetical protein
VCYKSKTDSKYIFPKWETAHLFVYNAIPFGTMLVCNALIIYKIKIKKQRVIAKTKTRKKRQNRLTIILVLITFTFMLLTTPSVIVHTFLRDYLKTKPYR